MIETIFRVIVIGFIILIILAIIGSVAVSYNLSISGYVDILSSFLQVVFYIIPFSKLKPIFAVVVAFVIYKISVAILKTLWRILPIAG